MRLALIILLAYLAAATLALGLTPQEKAIVGQMRDSISLLRTKLDGAQSANDSALSALTIAASQSADLSAQVQTAAAQVTLLAAERDALAARIAAADIAYERLNARYQTAQLIIALVSAFLVGLLVLQFTHRLSPPYGFIVPVAAGAAAFFAIYNII